MRVLRKRLGSACAPQCTTVPHLHWPPLGNQELTSFPGSCLGLGWGWRDRGLCHALPHLPDLDQNPARRVMLPLHPGKDNALRAFWSPVICGQKRAPKGASEGRLGVTPGGRRWGSHRTATLQQQLSPNSPEQVFCRGGCHTPPSALISTHAQLRQLHFHPSPHTHAACSSASPRAPPPACPDTRWHSPPPHCLLGSSLGTQKPNLPAVRKQKQLPSSHQRLLLRPLRSRHERQSHVGGERWGRQAEGHPKFH